MTEQRIKVEISARNSFWLNAVRVEWEHQFPDRLVSIIDNNNWLIDQTWLGDLQRVAQQCFAQVLLAPADPGRRNLFRNFLSRAERD
jgi:hypothetical protein